MAPQLCCGYSVVKEQHPLLIYGLFPLLPLVEFWLWGCFWLIFGSFSGLGRVVRSYLASFITAVAVDYADSNLSLAVFVLGWRSGDSLCQSKKSAEGSRVEGWMSEKMLLVGMQLAGKNKHERKVRGLALVQMLCPTSRPHGKVLATSAG